MLILSDRASDEFRPTLRAASRAHPKRNRYRVFADLEQCAGHFPQALIIVCKIRLPFAVPTITWAWASIRWCSQQCIKLFIGSEPARGGTRNISGTSHYHVL